MMEIPFGSIPFAYFGGFVLVNLLFMNSEISEIEGSTVSIVLVGVAGTVIATVVIFLKSFLENTARMSKKI